jgi:hypothetical protein
VDELHGELQRRSADNLGSDLIEWKNFLGETRARDKGEFRR